MASVLPSSSMEATRKSLEARLEKLKADEQKG